MVIDYRKLNQDTDQDAYPLPMIDDIKIRSKHFGFYWEIFYYFLRIHDPYPFIYFIRLTVIASHFWPMVLVLTIKDGFYKIEKSIFRPNYARYEKM